MPRVTITAQAVQGPYPTLPVAVNSLDIAMTAADVANKQQTPMTGGPIIVVMQNKHATLAKNVTFTSAPDSKKRVGDITNYLLQVEDIAMHIFNSTEGWRQADGMLYFEGDDALIKFAVINPSGV